MDASIDRNQHYMSSSYAHNGKIMLSAAVILLILVIIAFHIYFKWRVHRRRRNVRRRQDDPEAIISTTHDVSSSQGLDVSIRGSLPTFVYNSTATSKECAVCLSEFEDKEIGRVLPKCNHSFHVECIDMWFYSHSNCPLCRDPVQLLDIHTPAQHPAVSASFSVDSASDEHKVCSIS